MSYSIEIEEEALSAKNLILKLIQLALLLLLVFGCKEPEGRVYRGVDYRAFNDSKAEKLAHCLQKKKWRKAKKLITDNPQLINEVDLRYGNTLLIWAVLNDNLNVVKFLLKNNILDIKHKNYKKKNAVYYATEYYADCDSPILELLISSLKNRNELDYSTLHTANFNSAGTGCVEKLKFIRSQRLEMKEENQNSTINKITVLRHAMIQVKYESLLFLLDDENLVLDSLEIERIKEKMNYELRFNDADTERINKVLEKLRLKTDELMWSEI